MLKYYNPFKILYPILVFVGVGAGIILLIFAFSWLVNNIYTLIWVFLVLGCLIWLADSIYMTIQERINHSDKTDFPSETYER